MWRQYIRSGITAISPTLWNRMLTVWRSVSGRHSPRNVFGAIYEKNAWQGSDSVSGPGSSRTNTKRVREELPDLLRRHRVTSILDVPCGDAYWICECLPPNISYIGADIVPELIGDNRRKYPGLGNFLVLDLVSDPLPRSSLVLVRDCFIHLPNKLIRQALANVKSSGAQFVLTTTYPGVEVNEDVAVGGWRPINLTKAPFLLPDPVELIVESEGVNNSHRKSLALWSTSVLP